MIVFITLVCKLCKKSCKKSERKIKNEQKVTLSAQCCQMATTITLRYKHDHKHEFGENVLKRLLSIRKCKKKKKIQPLLSLGVKGFTTA